MNIEYLSAFHGANAIEKIKQASLFLSENPNTTLIIPEGDYILSTDFSIKLMSDVLSGRMTQNPQDVIFKPYYPYDCALTLTGVKNVKIMADGARFIIHGFMQALEINDCENVEISGLTTDYLEKPFSVGTIINQGKDYIDIAFYDQYTVTDKTPSPRIVSFDRDKKRFSPGIMEPYRKEQIAQNIVRYYADGGFSYSPNQEIIVIHTYHYRPNVFISNSRSVFINGLTIHAQCGMGVLAHRCENICLDQLKIIPADGLPISTNTDATHFTSCKGQIEIRNSVFAGSEDDVINVHNYYYSIGNIRGSRCDLYVNAPDYTHAQVVDYPDRGDTLARIDKKTLAKFDCFTVINCAVKRQRLCASVLLDRPIQKSDITHCYLINETRSPELIFENNSIEYNLARGALIKCKKAMVQNCVFKNTTGTAIHVSPESWWHEGGAAEYVEIKNNRFVHTGFGSYAKHRNASAICVEAQCERPTGHIHGKIVIENNHVDLEDAELAIHVSNAQTVFISDNEIVNARRHANIENVDEIMEL